MQYFPFEKELVSILVEDMKQMRIKRDHQLTEMRQKAKKWKRTAQ